MKKILFFILLLGALIGCEKDGVDIFADDEILSVSETQMNLNVEALSKTLRLKGPRNWTVDSTELASWCSIMPVWDHNGRDYITVRVEANKGVGLRTTFFTVITGEQRVKVDISQLGNEPLILSDKDSIHLGNDTTLFELKLVSNMKFEESSDAEWLRFKTHYQNDTIPLKITVSPNKTGQSREGKLIFKHKDSDYVKIITVWQGDEHAIYEPDGVESMEGNHQLKIVRAKALTELEGKEIGKSYDGNTVTHYHSQWQDKKDPKLKNIVLEYEFEQEASLNYFCYTPYGETDGFMLADVYVLAEGESDYKKIQQAVFLPSGRQIITLKTPVLKPQKIKFEVTAVYNGDKEYMYGTCAEMEFYSTQPLFGHIFEDQTYSSLKAGVTIEQILDIDDEVFRNIAQHLYQGTYPAGRIQTYSPSPLAKDPEAYGLNAFGLLDLVTGISVKQNENIVVFADNLEGKKIKISHLAAGFSIIDYDLVEGINKIAIDRDGLLYIKYTGSGDPVKLHLAGGNLNGFYDPRMHTPEEGAAMIQKSTAQFFDLRGTYVHLIFPTNELKKYASALKELVERYDRIVQAQQEFVGLYKYYPGKTFSRVCFVAGETTSGCINVENRIILTQDKMPQYCNPAEIKGDILVDIAHAAGHVHQVKAFSFWKDVTEATNDLNILYAQKMLGEPTILQEKGVYDQAFNTMFFSTKQKFENMSDASHMKSVPFWQLYLYMSEILNQPDAYQKTFKAMGKNTSQVDMFFPLMFSQLNNVNLQQFFEVWGFTNKGVNKGNVMPRVYRYLTEGNLEIFKTGGTLIAGSAAKIIPGTEVVGSETVTTGPVKITGNANAVAFEVRYKGLIHQVSTRPEFTIYNYIAGMQIFALDRDGLEKEVTIKK